MCGIVGIVNSPKAAPLILQGLENLEYRGYDSAGIYIENHEILKTLARVSSLKDEVNKLEGSSGIGHTRWATQGEVTLQNAHPHRSYHNLITLVHNGIIANDGEIKKILQENDYQFYGETDTEVLTDYIEYLYLNTKDVFAVMHSIIHDIKGEMAVAFMVKDIAPIFFIKRGSPLVIGKSRDTYGLASDRIALPDFSLLYYPNDNEYGFIDQKEAMIFKNDEPHHIAFQKDKSQFKVPVLKHFKHYMKQEIFEEPKMIDRIFYYLTQHDMKVVSKLKRCLKRNKVVLLGCGTSYNAAEYIVSKLNIADIEAKAASDFRKNHKKKTIYVFISQSGETYDLIKILKTLNRRDKALLITNNIHSTLARKSQFILPMNAGYEVAVAATKSYISSIILLTVLFCKIDDIPAFFEEVKSTVEKTLRLECEIKKLALKISRLSSIYYVGGKEGYPIVKEGALKIKEISYIHAESVLAGELKHGPIATVGHHFGALFYTGDAYRDFAPNIMEIKSRKAPTYTLGFSPENDLVLPKGPRYLEDISAMVALEILSYETAAILKCDIDKPRNLAKSVTVI